MINFQEAQPYETNPHAKSEGPERSINEVRTQKIFHGTTKTQIQKETMPNTKINN